MNLQIYDFDGKRQYSSTCRLRASSTDRLYSLRASRTCVLGRGAPMQIKDLRSRSNLRAARLCVAQTRSRLIM